MSKSVGMFMSVSKKISGGKGNSVSKRVNE
jgi:hypothetical protein